MINSDWKEYKLSDLATFRRGSFPQPYGLDKWYDDENGHPFIQVYDVSDNMKLKETTKRKISDLAAEQSVFIPKGTLILTIQGSIGRIAITHYDAYMDRTLLVFQSFRKPTNKRFFMYVVHRLFEVEKEKAHGSTIKTITKQQLSSFTIPLPPLPEQQKIAEILSTVDAKIEVIDQQITETQELKKGLMQRLLTKGIGHTEFKDSPLGKIPKSWDTAILSHLTSLITKGTTPTTNGFSYLDDGVNFVKVESIHSNGNFIPSMFAHVGNDCHDSFKRSQLSEGDILFTIAGALGRSAIVNKEILPANTNQAVAIIRLKNGDNRNYIFHYLRGDDVKSVIEKINVSTAQANLSLGQINKFKIPIPPLYEQHKIAEILNSVDKKLEILNEKKTHYQELKKGLMQQLLSGKVRVQLNSTISA